ncbi:hypothetical protein H1D32_11955 [Anaerobacillus sp. CMMVII]|uniref:hypothetical protein n=1 Tax=Anaerobacillus sp. CMMVII TaxID=2755588 RepID=UPI0021B7675B|nr:hypothetical protein [Anaerobacillus sp. CMMVII]MCT8138400.1 hypothetical protein [Anaerobacillus sp. CMMVII]
MKYFLIATLAFLTLVGCGQGTETDLRTGYEKQQNEYQVEIPVGSEDEAVRVVQNFISSELVEAAYSGLYLEQDPKTHVVVLIQEQFLNQELVNQFLAFVEKNSSSSSSKFLVELKAAKHSYVTMETIMNKLNESSEEILVTDRKVLSFGINEIENRIDLYVSTRADLNEELLNEITEGYEDILEITEGLMSDVDDHGLPTADPYIVGEIMEVDSGNRRILIEDQIYFSINDATIIIDSQGEKLLETDLQEGDEVAVWTDGAILSSLPAQGYAVVIEKR